MFKNLTASKGATAAFAIVILAIVGILIVPLAPAILDTLLAVNILAAGLVVLLAVTINEPLEFSAFAPALLIATLFRLSLDVSATRLILTQGHEPGGVGEVIPAFGEFVVRGNLVVGLIIFAILITIQFIVIASGSQRVAEVAARFTLDALPGKQMAIDADIHAGLLDRDAARTKRALLQKESEFFGAMDGAGKFVKGDAIAALVIVVLNLIGGVAVGVLYHGMGPGDALNTFALLTIGNALVTTLPAFLMSTSMGLMVTRVAASESLGADLTMQVLARPDVLRTTGIFAFVLALVPALPQPVFAGLGSLALIASEFSRRRAKRSASEAQSATAREQRVAGRKPDQALPQVGVDPLSLELGAAVAQRMVQGDTLESLLDRIGEIRKELARQTGFVAPGVHVRDDPTLAPDAYAIRVREEVCGRGSLDMDRYLVVASEANLEKIAGTPCKEPVYGINAKWIVPESSPQAMKQGGMVFDPISVLGSHLAETVRRRSGAIFGRQELAALVEHLRGKVPALIKDIGTDALPFNTVHKVFVSLLRERIWPRDIVLTFETLVDAAQRSRDDAEITEAVRKALVPPLLRARNRKVITVLMFDPEFERRLSSSWLGLDDGAPLDPSIAIHVRQVIETYVASMPPEEAILLCTQPFRRVLSDFAERVNVHIAIYSFGEIPSELEVRPNRFIEPPERTAVA